MGCDLDRRLHRRKATLAERLGLGPRQVRRHVADLEAAGLVQRNQRRFNHGGKTTNAYDLGGLVERLRELEPEFREVEERVKAARRTVSRPKHRRSHTENGPELA